MEGVIETENVALGDAVDALGGRQPVHLHLKDMTQARLVVGVSSTQPLAVEQTPHNLRDILPRLHIQVGESLRRVVEAAGVLLLQQVDHLPHHPLRREDLVGLLRRNIVEDILLHRRVEVVGEPTPQRHELAHGIVEHHLIEEMTLAVHLLAGLIDVVAAVAQQVELGLGDARHLEELGVGNVAVEVLQRRLVVAEAHEERGDGAREAAQVVAYLLVDRGLLVVNALLVERLRDDVAALLHQCPRLSLDGLRQLVVDRFLPPQRLTPEQLLLLSGLPLAVALQLMVDLLLRYLRLVAVGAERGVDRLLDVDDRPRLIAFRQLGLALGGLLVGRMEQQRRELTAHAVEPLFLRALAPLPLRLLLPGDGLTHEVVQLLSGLLIDFLAEERLLQRPHAVGVGLRLTVVVGLTRQLLHVVGTQRIVFRRLHRRNLVEDIDDGLRTAIHIADVGEEEIAHETGAHHFLRPYLPRNEHHLLGIEGHHLALVVLADDGEEVEQLPYVAPARIAVAAPCRRVSGQSVGHLLIVVERARGVEVEDISVLLTVVLPVVALI